MHFLINKMDNSVNFASEEEIPEFMNDPTMTYYVEASVDHMPEDTVFVDCFWDPENNVIIPNSLGLQRISEQELAEFINQQQLINQAITQTDTDKYNTLVNFLATVFPDNEQIKSILSDQTVTQDELQQIEDMLNNQ